MTNITKIAIGLDRGFGATKYFSDITFGHIDSLVAPITKERARDIITNNIDDKSVYVVKMDEQYYLVGSYVSSVEPAHAKRDLKRTRDGINETVLFVTGMGLASGNVEVAEVVITTGLPTDDHDRYKESYKKKILNDGKPYKFSIFHLGVEYKKVLTVIDTKIENQPKGTIISVINKKMGEGISWSELKSRRFGICDVGFNTTDTSMYVGKDIVTGDKINFSTFAMSQVVATAKKKIEDAFNCNKSEDDILKALITNEVKVKGKDTNCTAQIKEAFNENGKLLVSEITSNWEEMLDTFDELILTGGALKNETFAEILKKFFEEQTGWQVTIAENPQYANAFGFYLIAASIVVKL